jgi:hypothetical protein
VPVDNDGLLNAFQKRAARLLDEALVSVGSQLENRRVEGRGEHFIRAGLKGTSVEVFIYEDEAQLLGAGVDQRFEAVDYPTAEALSRAFIQRAVAIRRPHREGA